MAEAQFIGRKHELGLLLGLLRKKTASLVVIKGRRRIGKSRLIQEFAKKFTSYQFIGLAPDKNTSAQSQRDQFSYQLHQQTGLPEIKTDDWNKLFLLLNEKMSRGRLILVFDEITWMGSEDSDFLSKLHYAWENHLKKNPKLVFILCGSVSTWIEKNILSSTGYFGRVSLKMTLEELPLRRCNELLKELSFRGSTHEKLLLFSVTGGIPWYIEQIDPGLSAVENIKRMCFEKDGLLVDEFNYIFNDLFGKKRSDIHKNIVACLANGPSSYDEIAKALDYQSSGALSDYIEELTESGFINRVYTWSIETGKLSKLSRFCLKDNYLRFYLKYILPRLSAIKQRKFSNISLDSLPEWNVIMGYQFENLMLNNRKYIYESLGLDPISIVQDDPYFQTATTKRKGCQIDYLIQTKYKTLYVCDFKFSKNEIDVSVIAEMKEKISRLKPPYGYACIPVLIHINGVNQKILDAEYFGAIIDATEYLDYVKPK